MVQKLEALREVDDRFANLEVVLETDPTVVDAMKKSVLDFEFYGKAI